MVYPFLKIRGAISHPISPNYIPGFLVENLTVVPSSKNDLKYALSLTKLFAKIIFRSVSRTNSIIKLESLHQMHTSNDGIGFQSLYVGDQSSNSHVIFLKIMFKQRKLLSVCLNYYIFVIFCFYGLFEKKIISC